MIICHVKCVCMYQCICIYLFWVHMLLNASLGSRLNLKPDNWPLPLCWSPHKSSIKTRSGFEHHGPATSPHGDDVSVAPSSSHRHAMCTLHAHPERRGVNAAQSQHILPFHLNSWTLQRATITASCNKEMWCTQAQPSPWLQWSKLAPNCDTKCQPRLASAARMSADKNKNRSGKK